KVAGLLPPSRTVSDALRAELTEALAEGIAGGADAARAVAARVVTVHDLRGLALALRESPVATDPDDDDEARDEAAERRLAALLARELGRPPVALPDGPPDGVDALAIDDGTVLSRDRRFGFSLAIPGAPQFAPHGESFDATCTLAGGRLTFQARTGKPPARPVLAQTARPLLAHLTRAEPLQRSPSSPS